MPGRLHLTEEDERAEVDLRDRLRQAQGRLRELRDRRGLLLEQVRRLSDEQHALHEQLSPERDRVEATHVEYRELGRKLSEIRARRDALRPQLEMTLSQLKGRIASSRRAVPAPKPDQIRREMAALELRQQTQALPLAEENALIDRLRELRRELEGAERQQGERAQEAAEREAKEGHFRELRAEFERLGEELRRTRAERDARMASMRTRLAEVGGGISQIREKARARAQLFEKVEEINRELVAADREIRETLETSRARRQEARQTISEFTRRGRAGSEREALAQSAEEQFHQLMKHGKVTLGG